MELKDTYLYNVQLKQVDIQRFDEDNWIICKVEDGDFQGCGGPENLEELLSVFLDWAEANEE